MASLSSNVANSGILGSLSVGKTILGIVGLCLSMLLLVSTVGIWQNVKIGHEIESIAERYVPLTRAMTQITVHQLEQTIHFERALRVGEGLVEGDQGRQAFNQATRHFDEFGIKVDEELTSTALSLQEERDEAGERARPRRVPAALDAARIHSNPTSRLRQRREIDLRSSSFQ